MMAPLRSVRERMAWPSWGFRVSEEPQHRAVGSLLTQRCSALRPRAAGSSTAPPTSPQARARLSS